MSKLYIAMVGLPARGKSTLARRIREGLTDKGASVAIFNNGNVRRETCGQESTNPDFYNPENKEGREARESIAKENMCLARDFLSADGDVAILDAINSSHARREIIEKTLSDYPVLFIECVNSDPVLLDACVKRKVYLPEFKDFTREDALASFLKRIEYYEGIYSPVGDERYWMSVDATSNRILAESPCESSAYYPIIRNIVVTTWVRSLILARHGQTEFNIEGRIGGNPYLTAKGRKQADSLNIHLKGQNIPYIFTSSRVRALQTASPLLLSRPDAKHMIMKEFDEIWAGDCENMCYDEIRNTMPEVTEERNSDKFAYVYPNGESYAMLEDRVQRGVMRALFLAGDSPLMIIGHQAINRVILSLFLLHRKEDIPYIYIPQNQYYHISITPKKRLFELVSFT